jgi:hypothetical protein
MDRRAHMSLRKIHKANGCVQLITHMVKNVDKHWYKYKESKIKELVILFSRLYLVTSRSFPLVGAPWLDIV